MAISMLKIRRPLGRLIFNMGIAIPGKTVFLIETAPRCLFYPPNGCNVFYCLDTEWGNYRLIRVIRCLAQYCLTRTRLTCCRKKSKIFSCVTDNASPGVMRSLVAVLATELLILLWAETAGGFGSMCMIWQHGYCYAVYALNTVWRSHLPIS